jgi:thiamine biosynthesis lipoprotein
VTVLAPDLVSADVDATAAFVLGEWAEAWLAARRRTAVVVPAAGAAVVVGG